MAQYLAGFLERFAMTECNQQRFGFQVEESRQVVGEFNGGAMSSDGGLMLLREFERQFGVTKRFACCFVDHRRQEQVEYSVEALVAQRIYALCAGYEDLNDHDALRTDPIIRLAVGDELAGRHTLNRVENSKVGQAKHHRYCKVEVIPAAVEQFFVKEYLRAIRSAPKEIIIDADANDVTLYGKQEQRHFHAFYGEYCYLPLSFYAGDHLLFTKLRPSDIDASLGTVEALQIIVPKIRRRFPKARIILRGDSAFAREEIMAHCEANGIEYVLGLAKNQRLTAKIADELNKAQRLYSESGKSARVFTEFRHETLESWSRKRRVIAKAEHLEKGANPRFIVTSLKRSQRRAIELYEELYCARGDMENRIKEQLQLFSDRLSVHTFEGNTLRHYFSAVAYVLMAAFRRRALRNTELARAYFDTIRLKLFKLGARVLTSVRRVVIQFTESYPFRALFADAYRALLSP